MKIINIRSIEILTDGTINFSYIFSKSGKQVTLYEKDAKNSIFSKKYEKNQQVQVLSRTSYKSRYKF